MRMMLITQQCFSCCWAGVALNQRLFSFSHHAITEEPGGTQVAGGRDRQGSRPKLAKRMFQILWYRGKTDPGPAEPLLRNRLGIKWWVVGNCIVHNFFFIFYLFYHNYFVVSFSVLWKFLYLKLWVLIFVPSNFQPIPQQGRRMREWLCGVLVPAG